MFKYCRYILYTAKHMHDNERGVRKVLKSKKPQSPYTAFDTVALRTQC